MDTKKYHVVFEGQLTGDKDLAEVKRHLAGMFKMNNAQVDALFGGKPVVIKRDIDAQTAQKYATAFKKAGAVCKLTEAGNGNASSPAKSPATPAQAKPAPPASSPATAQSLAARDVVNIKVPEDLSGLSAAQPGEVIPVLPTETNVNIPDTQGLSVATDDGYLAPEKNIPEPNVDISNLSIKKDD